MGDLKTPFDRPVYGDTSDLSGDLATQRGTDPNIDTGGSPALQTTFDRAVVPTPGGAETGNSVSGLPAQPARYTPTEGQPPGTVEPPTLEDRTPGTIDK